MDTGNDEGRIERLNKALYRRGKEDFKHKRFILRTHRAESKDIWGDSGSEKYPFSSVNKPYMSFWKFFFIASIGFFIITFAVASIIFFGGSNAVSTKNVDILISGPVSVNAGEELQLQLIIENNNSVPLESVDLLIEYPEGTRAVGNLEQELTRVRKSLGRIEQGQVIKEPVRIILFGQEGDEKKFKIVLEYRVQDSNAIFMKEKEYIADISSSATSLFLEAPSEVISGQEFTLRATIVSNTDTVTRDILFSVEYPFGFSFISADQKPVTDDNTWIIGDLAPNGKRTITIRGVIEGQDGEEKMFRISSGAKSKSEENKIGVVYNRSYAEIFIARPFLSLILFINGESLPEYVIGSRDFIDVSLVWTNNLPTKIIDAQIKAQLLGDVINKSSVQPRNGFYNSIDNTILWDKSFLPELSEIESGAQGRTNFRLALQPLFTGGGSLFKNPIIDIIVSTNGNRLSESGVPEKIQGVAERRIKISSDVVFVPNIVHFIGPFKNTGPLPPEVGRETTYTIMWTAVNSSNNISRATVKTVLPPYVRWIGAKTPDTENISFNEVSREVTWELERLKAGAGVTFPPREVAFQVAFLPSLSQINQAPTVIGQSTFSGVDEFTDAAIRLSGKALTISLNTDPQFVFNQGKVIQSDEKQ